MTWVSKEAEAVLVERFGGVPPTPPVQKALNARLQEVGDGTATFSMQATKDLHNFVHVVHGGVLTSLAELAASVAILTRLEEQESFTFISQNTTYERPVRHEEVRAEAEVVRKGRRISLITVHLKRDDGKEVGRAHFTALSQAIQQD